MCKPYHHSLIIQTKSSQVLDPDVFSLKYQDRYQPLVYYPVRYPRHPSSGVWPVVLCRGGYRTSPQAPLQSEDPQGLDQWAPCEGVGHNGQRRSRAPGVSQYPLISPWRTSQGETGHLQQPHGSDLSKYLCSVSNSTDIDGFWNSNTIFSEK